MFKLLVGVLFFPLGLYWLGRWVERRAWCRAAVVDPVSDKQRAYITSLCRERGIDPPSFEGMTVARASIVIDALKHST